LIQDEDDSSDKSSSGSDGEEEKGEARVKPVKQKSLTAIQIKEELKKERYE